MRQTLETFNRLFDWRAVRLRRQPCSLCGHSVLVKFGSSEHAVRCLYCRANPSAMSLVTALAGAVPDLAACHVYELSSRGPLFDFLRSRCEQLTFSEFVEDTPTGKTVNGIRCEDVQNLTFADESFDVCTSTDVFEHVPDDAAGFREILRVLKPGGCTVFTVPLTGSGSTVERAVNDGGKTVHLMPPEYHDDHIRGAGRVLCFRNYGGDIEERLRREGFVNVGIVPAEPSKYWGYGRPVVTAFKPVD